MTLPPNSASSQYNKIHTATGGWQFPAKFSRILVEKSPSRPFKYNKIMFKKLILGVTLVSAMVACTEDFTDWSEPQQNAQPEIATFGDGSVSPVALIDFASLDAALDSVAVCSIVAPTSSDAAYSAPSYVLHLSDAAFNIGTSGKMAVSDLKLFLESTYGKAPYERQVQATVEQWISNGATSIKTATSEPFTVKAKLLAPVIYPHLYLIGAPSEWSPTCTTMPFTHSGKDVYDDPMFTVTFPVADGEVWFAFADDKTVESGDWANVFGAMEGNGANKVGETGYLARRSELTDDGSFKVSVDGDAKYVKVTVDMLNGTYLIEKVSYGEYIYEIGNESGWSTSHPLYGANGDGKYQGYYYLDGEFKFKPNPGGNWDGDYEWLGDNKLGQGSDNFPNPGAGFYQIDVDLAEGTYAVTEVKSITVVGNFNGWNQADAATHMTYNKAENCWEATLDLAGNGVKFAMNDEWTVSWGGANGNAAAYDNLSQNGGKDLDLPEGDGTYLIKLYLAYEGANKVVFTKQ